MATHPQTAAKAPITNVVTPVSDEFDPNPSSAATTVDAVLNGVVLGDKFETISSVAPVQPLQFNSSPNGFDFSAIQTAASLASAITSERASKAPEIPTLTNCEFVPLQPSYSHDVDYDVDAKQPVAASSETDLEILEAASILCMLSKARPNEEDVAAAMDLLAPTFEYEPYDYADTTANEPAAEEEEGKYLDEDMYEASLPNKSALRHPDRLAIDEDVDEVNQLHQYVRSDLLEIFVVPEIEDESDDDSYDPKQSYERITRGNSYTGSLSTTVNRHYPGRVGFRCVHCANVRPVSAHATKSSFYPLRLHNIYREVCAWQRIHFKNCPFVPKEVRGRYDWLKSSDTSRGKVRYWEISAQKIGLVNNPDRLVQGFSLCMFYFCYVIILLIWACISFVASFRDDGIVFAED